MVSTASSTTEDHLSMLKTGISKSIWHLSAAVVQREWQEHGVTPISRCFTRPQGQGIRDQAAPSCPFLDYS